MTVYTLMDGAPPRAAQSFADIDTDNDANLSHEELMERLKSVLPRRAPPTPPAGTRNMKVCRQYVINRQARPCLDTTRTNIDQQFVY